MNERMVLPTTTRGSEIQLAPPTTDAVVKAIEVADTPESADHLLKVHTSTIAQFGPAVVESQKPMKKTLEEHSRNMHLQYASNGCQWSGMVPNSSYNKYQDGIADIASKKLHDNHIDEVKIDFALSSASQLLRAFTSNDNPLDTSTQALFDELLCSYFAKNNLFAEVNDQGSFIYENDGGKIRRDANNNPIKADPEALRELFTDPSRGFQPYLKEHGFNSNIKGHNFPDEAPTAAKSGREAPKTRSARPAVAPDQGPTPTA